MTEIVKGWYPDMPAEHVSFVVHFADGYVRLARLAADAVILGPAMNVRELLVRAEIRRFFDRMLGTGDRRALYVVAVLTTVGWSEDRQVEGETIAHHFGLSWPEVQYFVEDYHRHFGIVPRGGRYRYISPIPLGIHLAVEAWATYPDLLRSLPEILPTEESKVAYYQRLKSIASNPQTNEFAREELAHFFRYDDFLDGRAVSYWSALSSADPDIAAHNVLQALTNTSVEERMQIAGDARREMVWALVRLAKKSSSFVYAAKSLALLGEAENERWSNNATGEFVDRYQLFLGGTALPYLDRLQVIDEIIGEGSPSIISLAIKALARVGNRNESRIETDSVSDELPEGEWRPSTGKDHLDCIRGAIQRLQTIARLGHPEIQNDLVEAANNISMLLRNASVREAVSELFFAIHATYPQSREVLRRIIDRIISQEKKYWKEIPPEDLREIEALHSRFEDSSLEARLLQFVGSAFWTSEEQPNLQPLAEELLANPDLVAQHWTWLTSGKAESGWHLGAALAKVDSRGVLSEFLPSLPNTGGDLRFLCEYVRVKRSDLGDDWYNAWIESRFGQTPKPLKMLFDVTWRCGATEYLAARLSELLRTEAIDPRTVGPLIYGNWSELLTKENLEPVLRAMTDTGHKETAIGLLESRLKGKIEELAFWDPIALLLVTSPVLICSKGMVSYYWKEVANRLIPNHASEIANSIFQVHANRISGAWFLEFSDAASVLGACVAQSPLEVWKSIQPYLSLGDAGKLTIGFPRGVIDQVPSREVLSWIAEKPEDRATLMAGLVSIIFSSDDTLESKILGEYGNNDGIAGSFFSYYVTGSWTGQSSAHWAQLANKLEEVAKQSSLPKLRRWALASARQLHIMEERDRLREEEYDIGRR